MGGVAFPARREPGPRLKARAVPGNVNVRPGAGVSRAGVRFRGMGHMSDK